MSKRIVMVVLACALVIVGFHVWSSRRVHHLYWDLAHWAAERNIDSPSDLSEVLWDAAVRRSQTLASVQERITKMTLEGDPVPELDVSQYVGSRPTTVSELKGSVVLLYFWAHWCGDCRREKPILESLYAEYADRGLVVVGPTRLYGYAAGGEEATPSREMAYLNSAYQQDQPIPAWMPVPVSGRNFARFDIRKTPTLVLIDRQGIVRWYHPGYVDRSELVLQIEQLLVRPAARSNPTQSLGTLIGRQTLPARIHFGAQNLREHLANGPPQLPRPTIGY